VIGDGYLTAEAATREALLVPLVAWWRQVAASVSYAATRNLPPPEFPEFAVALAGGFRAGWADARASVLARVEKTLPVALRRALRTFEAFAAQPDGATLATRTVLRRLEAVTLDEAMVDRYVATRVPPLTWAVQEKARRGLASRVGRGAMRGESWQDIRGSIIEDYGLTRAHAENVARTELAHMYSNGSLTNYLQTDLVTMLEFVAILDSRTTAVCRRLDGKIFRAGEATARVSPPLHFQCRSILSPVMPWEGAEATSLEDAFAGADDDEFPFDGFGEADLPVIEPYRLAEMVRPDLATATGETKRALGWLARRATERWQE